ncbi:ArsR family transcriptional regulator [Vibrio chagasii]|uniref:Lrp/AsnC family transcriptional regulator n=1 Tax=unclassified Vibrio TaxID=2614977 RepID=UPI00149366C0|nr:MULTISPECIES: Lrp/AsnC family transcriptional regulator [unclassified Vibrio]CAH6795454.1 ArsR family transcriptional regulator [Vibrio chagasii]NOI39946.1 Lrp/AsnC family transcriptional regulator [Vibrio sp. 070316B]NOI83879.1 Lrp/AsnC family transcriptional regulator [Vibrio sp. 99K-1]CAH6795501.1 ArsR family transcriptional regulator [Vibrio chagasii]CAH6820610.1 ArsR family transcriptional regulator [Vibrio chagasii]
MDKFDRQILDILKTNARCSVSDIAREVSLSRSAVNARIKKLESDKVIKGYCALVDEPNQIKNVCAYISLKFDLSSSDHSCESYANQIHGIDGVQWCHSISGETDMMLYVEVESMERLNQVRDQLQSYPELRHLMTHTVLTEFFNKLSTTVHSC